MRKILLSLGFLMLNVFCLNIFAQPLASENRLSTASNWSVIHAPTAESVDDLGTELAIYSLIIAVYGLYWLKQRA